MRYFDTGVLLCQSRVRLRRWLWWQPVPIFLPSRCCMNWKCALPCVRKWDAVS